AAFLATLSKRPVKIVWTMHNRRPHHWDEARGLALYKAWAPLVHGVIHHSEWGMRLIREELPFRPDAKHVVVPHGHFGRQMPPVQSREELEALFKLPPCGMRLGVLGRPQKTKQID